MRRILKNLFGGKKNMEQEDGKVFVKEERCPQNHRCPSIRVCPVGALTQNGYDAPRVDMEKCILCKKCIMYCPMRAIAFG